MESCLYEGRVWHRRFRPIPHAFEMPLFLVYLDLAEIDEVFRGRWLWSASRPALARFRREDHLGDPRLPLDVAVRDAVEERTGRRPAGPIRLLTHLRYAGYGMNPVSFHYCFEPDGRALAAIVADVTNTPWKERHVYVLPVAAAARRLRFTSPKEFHVSPFHPMNLDYTWSFLAPGRSLHVRIETHDASRAPLFDAVLALRRREIGGAALARALVRHPLMTAQVTAGIYWQALRLHVKGAPHHPHPRDRRGRGRVENPI
jgi:DUF1365 family protein